MAVVGESNTTESLFYASVPPHTLLLHRRGCVLPSISEHPQGKGLSDGLKLAEQYATGVRDVC